jgi:AraC family transcriptional regulator
MQPRLVQSSELHLVGLDGLFAGETMKDIPALWARFAPRMHEVAGRRGHVTYGACRRESRALGGKDALRYAASVEVEPTAATPAGMVRWVVAPGRYAVFTHEGHISAIGETWDCIWDEWMPASQLQHRVGAYELERYDERWNPSTGEGPVEIWIPVV